MKLKTVCAQTGLTQKTVRFYEDKHLISPKSVMKNGRSYREYSETDIKALQEIATLRKAFFSLEEIYLMQQDPDEIADIVQEYTHRVSAMAATMTVLANTAKTLDVGSITDISALAQAMDPTTKGLPLPSYDIKPHFKQIEEAETAEITRQRMDQQLRTGDSPFFLEHQKFTNRLGLFNENYAHNTMLSGGSANFPLPQEPKLLRIINLTFSGMITILTLTIFYFMMQRRVDLVELWQTINVWLITLDLTLITVRLMTFPIYRTLRGHYSSRSF